MDCKDIKYIAAIVKYGSFSKAAKALYVSQPALSQSVQRIEESLGLTLFERSRNFVKPTEAGLYIAEQGMPIVTALENLELHVTQRFSTADRPITIGISQFYGHHMLPSILKAFKMMMPSRAIQIVEGESKQVEQYINDGRVDVGVFPEPIYTDSLRTFPVLPEDILLALSGSNTEAQNLAESVMTDKGILTISAFSGYPFILLNKGLKLRQLVDNLCEEEHFVPKAVIETENLDTCRALVAEDYGISFLPSTLANKISDQSLVFYPLAAPMAHRNLVIVARPDVAKRLQLEGIKGYKF